MQPPGFALLLAALFHWAAAIVLPTCRPDSLNTCGLNQKCVQSDDKSVCQCEPGFIFNPESKTLNDACCDTLPTDLPSDGSHSSATTIIVTLVALSLITCGLVLAIRRYNLINWMRQKLNRRDNSVMYEDVMIGQDDPPIAA